MLSSFSSNGYNLFDLLVSSVIFLIILSIIAFIYFHDRKKLSKKFSKNTYNFVPPNNTNIGTLNELSQQQSIMETQKYIVKTVDKF